MKENYLLMHRVLFLRKGQQAGEKLVSSYDKFSANEFTHEPL